MEAGAAVDYRLKTLERTSDSQHQSIGDLRAAAATHETAITVQAKQLEEHEHDLAKVEDRQRDFEKALVAGMKEVKTEVAEELSATRRYLLAATLTFTGLMLTGFGYILQAVLHG